MFAVVCCIIASSCTVFVERHFYNVRYSQNYIHRVTSGLSIGSEAVISSLCDRPITDSGTAYVRNIKSSSNHVTKLFNIMAVMKRALKLMWGHSAIYSDRSIPMQRQQI